MKLKSDLLSETLKLSLAEEAGDAPGYTREASVFSEGVGRPLLRIPHIALMGQ